MSQPEHTPAQTNLGLDEHNAGRLGEVLDGLTDLIGAYRHSKRNETNWRTIKWTFFSTIAVAMVLAYLFFYPRLLGFQTGPLTESVARITINGQIAPGTNASADRIVPLIQRACQSKHISAVLLDINSGGGAPSESERMISALKFCRTGDNAHKPKKIYALINGAGASAAYMIAMHADRVYAGRYSLVGSIGAVLRYNDLSKLANRFGVHEKAYRSAPLKGGPSLISGSTPEDDQAYQELVSAMGEGFLAEVKVARKGKLNIDDKLLFSGRVWTASQALDFGLIDEIAVLEDLKTGVLQDAPIYEYRQKSSFAEGMGLKAMFQEVVNESMEARLQ